MSFQSLISGSECAAPANPLSQVLKHAEHDRSLQQDRIAGPSGSRLHHLPGTSANGATEQDLAMARQFFEGPNSGPMAASFRRPELMYRMSSPAPQELNSAWGSDFAFKQSQSMAESPAAWAAEFGQTAHTPGLLGPSNMPQAQQRSYFSSPGMYSSQFPISSYNMGMSSGIVPTMQTPFDAKGKGREADFEAAFAQATASLNSTSKIEEVADDGVSEIQQGLENAKLGEESLDFQSVWEQMQQSELPPPEADLAKWEAEFNQLMNAQRDDLEHDYGVDMQRAWESSMENGVQFDEDGIPILQKYVFEADNKYLDPSTSRTSPLKEAKALLEQNGSLSEAALLLEAAIQKGDLGEGGYEAWILLGETRIMDEHEDPGMRALMEGVRIAEAAGAAGVGMMSLAISFTNEAFDKAAYTMLVRWLKAKFPDFPLPPDVQRSIATNATWNTHAIVADLFLDLARNQHRQGVVDPDVQIGLGVLFYSTSKYDQARDCFEAALSMRPNDYLLWNRLGSSLSNGSKPEEALGAYRQALQLRPTYTRAIYNVGVACLNIGAHKEAAEHFLSALALQESSGGETSEQLWFTLRRAFLAMDRSDLAEKCAPEGKGRLDRFRAEGFDF